MPASTLASDSTIPKTASLSKLRYKIPLLKLMLVKEAGRKQAPKIRSALDAASLFSPLTFATEEHFVSLHLNTKFEVIGLHEVSHGTLSASLVHPREVFKAALVANSYAIIVCHNHPSGAKLEASREDFETTEKLISAGKILGVAVLDHLILGPQPKSIFSFRENHPELWERGS